MGILLAEMLHGGLERGGHVAGFDVALVEELHEVGGAAVVHIPEGEQQRRGSGAEEAALEAEKLVAGGDKVHAGGAAAEGDVACGEAHLVEVVEVEIAVAEADAGKHGVVLAIGAVGGDVQERGLGPLFFESVDGSASAEDEIGLGKDTGDGLHFGEDVRRTLVGDAHDQRGFCVVVTASGGLFLAESKDGGAGCIGDGVRVAEIGVAIFEGMKGKKVKRPVGDEDQMLGVEMRTQRRDQFGVKSFEMALGGEQQGLLETLRVGCAHAEFGELKAQEMEEVSDAGQDGDGSDLDGVASDDGGHEAVAGGIVFDEGAAGGENGL